MLRTQEAANIAALRRLLLLLRLLLLRLLLLLLDHSGCPPRGGVRVWPGPDGTKESLGRGNWDD